MTVATTPPSEAARPPRATRREWTGLAVLVLACVVYSMDLTVLHLAVPHLSADLQPSSVELLWIVDIYGFMVAGSLVTMGTLGDRIGRRRLLMIGGAAFAATSVIAAFATSAEMLIAARALLGLAGATVAPSTLSLISNMFADPTERTKAIGLWIAGFSVGGAIGPLAGGLVLEYFHWGAVFLLAVPVMVALLILAPLLLPEFRDEDAGRIDFVSAALATSTLLAVMYGLKEIGAHGVEADALAFIAGGLVLGALFARRQAGRADPMIDLRLFRIPAVSASLTAYLGAGLFGFGVFLFTSQYMQLVLGLSPLVAGAWSLPTAVAVVISSMGTSTLTQRFRPSYVMAGGLLISSAGFVCMSLVGTDSLALLIAGMTVLMFGMGPVFTLVSTFVLASAPPERAGAASGISETCAELGGAMGIAVIGSIGTAVYRSRLDAASLPGVPPEAVETSKDTLGAAALAADSLPAQLGESLRSAADHAFVDGLQVVSIVGAVAMVVIAAIVAVALRNVHPDHIHTTKPDPTTQVV